MPIAKIVTNTIAKMVTNTKTGLGLGTVITVVI